MELITLKNGFRVALENNSFVRSCAVNLYIGCGSVDEDGETTGMAHFLEHMLFKGTETLSNEQLSQKIDCMGGQFNAYTAKEYTCVFCHVMDSDVKEALSMILDMTMHPKMDKKEIETERGVIIEEINMYEDSPEDCAADAMCELIYKNSGLDNNILGTVENIKSFSAEQISDRRKKYYVPERMVLSVCGNFNKTEILDIVENAFGGLKNTGFPIALRSAEFCGGMVLKKRDFEQTQVIIASEGYPAGSEKRFAAAVFSAIAGGNSSSRINMRIREELGLAYSAYTCTVAYRGVGSFMMFAGTAHKNHLSVIKETLQIMDKCFSNISCEELDRVKAQFKASSVLGGESVAAISSAMGRELLYSGKYTGLDEIIRRIDLLKTEDIVEAGKELWNKEKLALCVMGKPESEKIYKNLGF